MKSYVGIDWSEARHDVRVHNEAGACVARFAVPHTLEGFQQLDEKLQAINANPVDCLVAIETHDNLLVDFLCEREYTLYVLAPSSVASNRSRYRASGAKDDDHDALVMADLLRTDHQRLIPWRPDGSLVRQMRIHLSWVDDLTGSIVRQHNRLRANLLRYYPQALAAFDLKTYISLAFLQAFPSPQALETLSYEQFVTFFKSHSYNHCQMLPGKYAQLTAAGPQAEPAIAAASQARTVHLAGQLATFLQQKAETIRLVNDLFVQHEDAFIFDSLPGAGELLAPKLLVMFGDRRDRYPDRTILPAIAGTCPVTKQSGKSRWVDFRLACNRSYRRAAQQFAICSVTNSVWAAGYFQRAKRRGLSDSHAYRCLANRWLHIIWTLWQRREPYDEAYHLKQVHRHRRPQGLVA